MSTIEKSIVINAPIEKVFKFMEDPSNLPEIWPSMVEIKNIRQNENGWPIYEWVYKMAGVKFDGESDTVEVIPEKKVVTESTKGIQSRFDFDYTSVGSKTELQMKVKYTIPIPLLSKVAEQIIAKLNDHEADLLLINIKARMEA